MSKNNIINIRQKDRIIILAALTLSILFRVALILTKAGHVNSDEAIIGIMAKHIAEGERPIFYYGQTYYVPWESYLAAPIVSIFGLNQFSIRFVPITISAATCIVFYILGDRIGGHKVASGSALVSAIPPVTFILRQIKGDAAFSIVLFLGTILLVLLIDYSKNPHSNRLLIIGAISMIGLSSHPIMGYYLITAIIIIFTQWIARGTTEVFGSYKKVDHLPYIIGLIVIALAITLRLLKPLFKNIIILIKDTLPILFGFYKSTSYSLHQKEVIEAGIPLFFISILCSILTILMMIITIKKERDNNEVRILTIYACVVITIFSLFVLGNNLTKDVYTKIRFIFPIYSILPLAIYSLFNFPLFESSKVKNILLGSILLVNLGGYFSFSPDITSIENLSEFLLNNHISSVYINYWDGYRLAVETNEKVKPYIIDRELKAGNNRVESYKDSVLDDKRPAYILKNEKAIERFEEILIQNSITYKKVVIDQHSVYWNLSPPLQYNWEE